MPAPALAGVAEMVSGAAPLFGMPVEGVTVSQLPPSAVTAVAAKPVGVPKASETEICCGVAPRRVTLSGAAAVAGADEATLRNTVTV